MIGCHIVEIDTRADLDRALDEPVAMVVLLGKQEHLTEVRLEEIASVVKPRGIPIMVDAASEHIERPSPWLVRGADLVDLQRRQVSARAADQRPAARLEAAGPGGLAQRLAASGAGPADEGIEGGHRRRPRRARALVRGAWPRGRAPAMVRRPRGHRRAGRRICGVPRARSSSPRASTGCRGCRISWDRWQYPLDGLGLRQRVLDGEPRIMLDDNSATDNSIAIDPFQLQPGEAAQVGDAIVAALRAAADAEPAPRSDARRPTSPATWELRVDFLQGSRTHRLAVEQRGPELAGHQCSIAVRGAGQRLAQRHAGPALVRLALRSEHDLLFPSMARSATAG